MKKRLFSIALCLAMALLPFGATQAAADEVKERWVEDPACYVDIEEDDDTIYYDDFTLTADSRYVFSVASDVASFTIQGKDLILYVDADEYLQVSSIEIAGQVYPATCTFEKDQGAFCISPTQPITFALANGLNTFNIKAVGTSFEAPLYICRGDLPKEGWAKKEGKWYYLDVFGNPMKGMWVDFQSDEMDMYFFDETTGAMKTGWLTLTEDDYTETYYFLKNGKMAKGLHQIGKTWYRFDEYGGTLEGKLNKTGWKQYAKGWCFQIDGKWATRWHLINNNWYYFNSKAYMQTGWQKVGGSWYYLQSSGVMKTGWLKQGGKWYYLKPEGGAMATGWTPVDDNEGSGDYYYMNSSGVMQTGWVKSNGKWYYLKPSGKMVWEEEYKINGKTHLFDENGAWIKKK